MLTQLILGIKMELQKPTLILLVILCLLLVTIPEIGIVTAESTIYIRADGSIEGTDKIQKDGNIYTFTSDVLDSIVVEKDDIVMMEQATHFMGMEAEQG